MAKDQPDFVFIGENLALDLINTEKIIRKKQRDLLQSEDDVKIWWELIQSYYPDMESVHGAIELIFDSALLDTIKTLRENLRTLFGQFIIGEKPTEEPTAFLNSLLQKGALSLVWEDKQTPQLSYDYGEDPYAALLLPIALSALNLLTRSDLERLHLCQNNNCIMMFYDNTKNGTRRWCSTACRDRERSAQRYREIKEQQPTDT